MEVGVSGYIEFKSSVPWGTVRVYYEETYDSEANTSDLKITSIKVKSTNWYGVVYYPDGLVKVNGITVITLNALIGTHSVSIDSQGSWYTIYEANSGNAASGIVSGISHNIDGSKSVSIQLTGNQYTSFSFLTLSGNYGSGWSVNSSQNIPLTTIQRPSTIGASDANIGSKSTIVVTRKNPAYVHSKIQ